MNLTLTRLDGHPLPSDGYLFSLPAVEWQNIRVYIFRGLEQEQE